ncbi:MAG: helix-hairpin-helix domain-containing protein [Acidobacteria bacterium]|nr:helix-hairpin-helix domain-containing protein [Acidobacteriota bacterium]
MKQKLQCLALMLTLVAVVAALAPALHAAEGPATADKVNINTADAEQLATLPGVGPATAKRIVEFRAQSGPFKRLEDLMAVKGIGEKKFLKLKDRLTL